MTDYADDIEVTDNNSNTKDYYEDDTQNYEEGEIDNIMEPDQFNLPIEEIQNEINTHSHTKINTNIPLNSPINAPINIPFHLQDDDKISKTSKLSKYSKTSNICNASLLRDLEYKWDLIEKTKSRKPSFNSGRGGKQLPIKVNNNNNNLPLFLNIIEKRSHDNFTGLFNSMSNTQSSFKGNKAIIESYNTKITVRGNKEVEMGEFESFIHDKAKHLEKYKKDKDNMEGVRRNDNDHTNYINDENDSWSGSGGGHISQIGHISNNTIVNSGNNWNFPSIVYESNCNKRGDRLEINENHSSKPSFLKSNINSQPNKIQNNPLLFRGSNFINCDWNNNPDNINNLVYESGSGYNGFSYSNSTSPNSQSMINPSKNLISKIQNIYGIITHEGHEDKSKINIQNTQNNNHTQNHINNSNSVVNLVNSIDKSYSIKNLDKNFDNIFNKINPSYKRFDTSLKINYKIDTQSKNPNINSNADFIGSFSNDPLIKNKLNKLFTKKENTNNNKNTSTNLNTPEFNRISFNHKHHDKILQKISENSNLLKNLFNHKKKSDNFNKLNQLNQLNTTTTGLKLFKNNHLFNSPYKHEKLCGKNNFDTLMNRMSAVSSFKVTKIMNINLEE